MPRAGEVLDSLICYPLPMDTTTPRADLYLQPIGQTPPRANQCLLSNQTFENIPYDDPDPYPPTKLLIKAWMIKLIRT